VRYGSPNETCAAGNIAAKYRLTFLFSDLKPIRPLPEGIVLVKAVLLSIRPSVRLSVSQYSGFLVAVGTNWLWPTALDLST
jgi:hypothetical protein